MNFGDKNWGISDLGWNTSGDCISEPVAMLNAEGQYVKQGIAEVPLSENDVVPGVWLKRGIYSILEYYIYYLTSKLGFLVIRNSCLEVDVLSCLMNLAESLSDISVYLR